MKTGIAVFKEGDRIMKNASIVSVFVLTLLCLTLCGNLSAQAEKLVAGVHIVNAGEDLESKRRALGLPYYLDVDGDAPGQIFLLMPTKSGLRYEVFGLEMAEDGQLHLGSVQQRFGVSNAGEGIVLRHRVPEGIPNLAVCLMDEDRQRQCWVPRYSGLDGSLVLDEGFYPAREDQAKNESTKTYAQASEALLTGTELLDQPYVMVSPLKNAGQLARMAAEYRFVPKGTINPEKTHHFLFMPLILPAAVRLHIIDYRGGDGFMRPVPEMEIRMDDQAAVLSLDLFGLNNPDKPDEEKSYVFVWQLDGEEETHLWYPVLNNTNGRWEGHGMGASGKFIPWPYGQ